MKIIKIQDNFNDRRSAADRHFDESGLKRFYRTFRPSIDLPKNFLSESGNVENVTKRYSFRGFQFGNWVTTEDRIEYLSAMYICCYDLQKVMRFKNNNLGMNGRLGIAFGSRGVPGALAHYEPMNQVINISRYSRDSEHLKSWRFINTGGIGSFAHEYGHFLDGLFGQYSEPHKDYVFLSGSSQSVSKKRIEYDAKKYPIRHLMEDILQKLFYNANGSLSKFSERLIQTGNAYLNKRVEVWARVFEHYVHYKLLHNYNIKNIFLSKTKYAKAHYLTEKELKTVIPLIDKLMIEIEIRSRS